MIKFLARQKQIFLTAVMFYTRIPCGKNTDHKPEYLTLSTKYFPLIGWIIGGAAALIFYLLNYVLPASVSIIISMISSILLTGGFHEDGFADFCDGFGGGWTKEKILEIMKDSRIGTYGALGIVMIILLKFFLLSSIDVFVLPFLLIVSHSLSRFTAATIIYTHQYVRADETSKVKPISKGISFPDLIIAAVFGILPIFLLQNEFFFLLIFIIIPVNYFLGKYFDKWIGGYTGDCLGATQQISEILIYLSFLIIWKFI
jgi:adenosylcobinamide-GDP ribazoletransferase